MQKNRAGAVGRDHAVRQGDALGQGTALSIEANWLQVDGDARLL